MIRLFRLFIPIALLTAPALGCPMCKDSTVDTANNSGITQSANLDFNNSIYFMLGGFVTIVGFTGRVMWKAAKPVSPNQA